MTDDNRKERDEMSRKEQVLNDALNMIDDDMLEAASALEKKKRRKWPVVLASVAAAAVLLAAALPFVLNSRKTNESLTGPITTTAGGRHDDYASADGPHHEFGYSYEKEEGGTTGAGLDYDDGMGTVAATTGPGDVIVEGEGMESEGQINTEPEPGQLTAAAWNDNEHFSLFKSYFAAEEQGASAGKFVHYADWFPQVTKRRAVLVQREGEPVVNAIVRLKDGAGNILFNGRTDVNGLVYLFGEGEIAEVSASGQRLEVPVNEEETIVEFGADQEKSRVIELMYVLDVTGSMGDELYYIKSEVNDVVRKIRDTNEGVQIRLAFLCYRDDGDDEKFYYVDFADVSDEAACEAQLAKIKKVDAYGGGDAPEAVDEALLLAMQKDWSEDSVKVVFHILDAPSHADEIQKTRYQEAVGMAAEKGVRLCPVVASAADPGDRLLESQTRCEAVMTGGTFCYITDDSGIGGEHIEPNLPDAVHEYLNAMMVRLVNGYYNGVFEEPIAWNE